MTKAKLQAGDRFHFLSSGFTFAINGKVSGGRTSVRGQTVTVTADLIEASTDRLGSSWLDLVDDPKAQEARWGRAVFSRGEAPADVEQWTPGSPEWQMAREQARQEAWALPSEDERAAALQAVQDRYGRGPSTATYNGEALFR